LYKLFGANPTDILIIRSVLRKLKHRNENIPPDDPSRWLLNRGCLDLTTEALSSIDWKKYENLRGNMRSLVVMAAVEVFAILLFLHTYGTMRPYFLCLIIRQVWYGGSGRDRDTGKRL
jgi:hypothetical protein